ncbi:MAG: hypothetical protein WEC75_12135 [Dehalococcoidia bacterium]
MENAVPALIIAAILMLATAFLARSGFMGVDAIGQELRASEIRYGEQNRTGLTVTATSIDGSGANVTVTVRNDGQTPLADFGAMDVLVQYFSESGTRYDKWLPYTSGGLTADTWTAGTFTDDVFEPGILNPGEGVEVLLRVNPVVGAGTTNRAVVGSERGVTVQTLFDGP